MVMKESGSIIKLRIENEALALFKYVMESYENLAILSTLNSAEGLVQLYVPNGNLNTVNDILENLKKEIDFHIVD